jgi:hypothetical protein
MTYSKLSFCFMTVSLGNTLSFVKRVVTIIDCLAVSITVVGVGALVIALVLRSLFILLEGLFGPNEANLGVILWNSLVPIRELAYDIYAARGDPWQLAPFFVLLWAVCKWKAGFRALEDLKR